MGQFWGNFDDWLESRSGRSGSLAGNWPYGAALVVLTGCLTIFNPRKKKLPVFRSYTTFHLRENEPLAIEQLFFSESDATSSCVLI